MNLLKKRRRVEDRNASLLVTVQQTSEWRLKNELYACIGSGAYFVDDK